MEFIRNFLWKILGIRYYVYLKGRRMTYLKDATWAKIGSHTYDNGAFVWRWFTHSALEIGKYGSIAANTNFICDSGYHTESEVTSFPLFHEILGKDDAVTIGGKRFTVRDIKDKMPPEKSGITIGHDVWIGMNATILPGLKIGNGATILAGAVIAKDVPDYTIVGGVPGAVVAFKHSPEIIAKLNAIAWWDWPDEKVRQHVDDFYLPIGEFINKHFSTPGSNT